MSRTDINKVAQTILIPLLAEVYGYTELKNLDSPEYPNYPAIDLGDETARVSFQVTSTSDNDKVKHTLEKFVDNKFYENYDRLIIYILKKKQKSYSGSGYEEIIQGKFTFDKDKDIWDYRDILREVANFQIDKARRVESILEAHFGEGRTLTEWEVVDNVERVVNEYTQLFVGREEEFQKLDKFLGENSSGLKLVKAGAGFGKTALLANWVNVLQDKNCFIAYHFFTQRYRSVKSAYRNLLRQLYIYYKPTYEQIPNDEQELRIRLYNLLREYAAREGEPLIIVIDGLDEAENPFSPPFPNPLPENVYVIASARAEEGDEHKYLEYWTDNSQKLNLSRLSCGVIANWLRQTGEGELAAFAEDIHFVAQLDEITQGFPLYLRYLTEELTRVAKQGQDVREVLAQTPKGFERYVEQQLKRLDELGLPDERWQFFALLAVAKGALEKEDVKALTGMRDRQLRQLHLCWQVTRWMRITEGKLYAFAHPLLATTFAKKLEGDAKDALQDLIDYCARWQKHQSRYALRHYAEHLREVKRWEELYAIARKQDFAVAQREYLPDEPDLPLKTVQTALLGAAEEDKAEIMANFLLVHAHRLGQTNAQESPLDALRSGSLERAWKLADMYEIERRTLWYLLLAWELKDTARLEEARGTLERLQHKQLPRLSNHPATDWQSDYAAYFLAHVFEVSEDTSAALGQQLLDDCYRRSLCRILSDRGYFTAAIETALSISWDLMPMLELEYIAKAQAKKGDREAARATFAKALEITRKLLPNSLWVMGDIAEAQIGVGEREAARATFAETIETAKKIPYQPSQVRAFVAIADKQAAVGEFNDALYTLQRIDGISNLENSLKALVLRATAEAEEKAGNTDKARVTFASAIEIAHGIEDKEKQADVLIEIATAQAEVGEFVDARATAKTIECRWKQGFALEDITTRQAYVREFSDALETATEIKSQLHQPMALQAVACEQAKAEDFPAALATAHRIEELMWKAQALKIIAIRQAESSPFTDDALKIALEIEDESEQTQALVGIVKAQTEVGNFHAALATNNRIKDASGQQDALAAIAEAYAKAKNFDDAFEAAEIIENQPMRVRTLGAIAKIQAEASQLPEARATFATFFKTEPEPKPEISFLKARTLVQVAEVQIKNEQKKVGADTASIAHKIAQSITHPTQQAIALALTADILIKAGNIKEAKAICESAFEIAQKISNKKEHERSNSFKLIAQAQARAMEFDAAIETALMIKIGLFFAEALLTLTQLQIGADAQQRERWKTILTNAHKFYENEQHFLDLSNKVEVLSIIAVARVAIGDKETGLATLTQLYEAAQAKKSRERDKNLSTIAAAQAEAGDIATALKITEEIEDEWEQVRALCKIAWEQLNTGKKEKLQITLAAVLKARDKIQDEHKRVKALRKIAQIQAMQAKAEVREQAVRTTELILIDRNNLLGSIASILAEVNDKQNFKKLLISCAYYLDIAYEMCGYLARLYPEKAAAVAKVLKEFN